MITNWATGSPRGDFALCFRQIWRLANCRWNLQSQITSCYAYDYVSEGSVACVLNCSTPVTEASGEVGEHQRLVRPWNTGRITRAKAASGGMATPFFARVTRIVRRLRATKVMLATKSDLLRGVLLHVPAWAIVATA